MIAFVISNSYASSTILSSLGYITDMQIDSFILLEENHCYNELVVRNNNVTLCRGFEEGVNWCDTIIVINKSNVPPEKICLLNNMAAMFKKPIKYVEFDNKSSLLRFENIEFCEDIVSTVFLISIGEFSQFQQSEITLCKILGSVSDSNNCYSYRGDFKTNTNVQNSIVFSNLQSGIQNSCSLHLLSFAYSNLQEFIKDFTIVQLSYKTRPNCILLNVEANFSLDKQILNILSGKLNKQIDTIIVSNYAKVLSSSNTYRPIYYVKESENVDYIIINDCRYEDRIKKVVNSKLFLPKGVIVL